jgi:hypothetical protein
MIDRSQFMEAPMTTYDPSLSLRAARDVYFEANGFGYGSSVRPKSPGKFAKLATEQTPK